MRSPLARRFGLLLAVVGGREGWRPNTSRRVGLQREVLLTAAAAVVLAVAGDIIYNNEK